MPSIQKTGWRRGLREHRVQSTAHGIVQIFWQHVSSIEHQILQALVRASLGLQIRIIEDQITVLWETSL